MTEATRMHGNGYFLQHCDFENGASSAFRSCCLCAYHCYVRPPPPPPWGIGRDLTFIKANCPWLRVNNRSNVYTTWSDKRSNACPTMVKCVASNNIHASNPHLIPTSPQGRGVSRNNDRCINVAIPLCIFLNQWLIVSLKTTPLKLVLIQVENRLPFVATYI